MMKSIVEDGLMFLCPIPKGEHKPETVETLLVIWPIRLSAQHVTRKPALFRVFLPTLHLITSIYIFSLIDIKNFMHPDTVYI